MKREDLEHIIAAAATISGEDEIMVLGSQAMLASFPDAPDDLLGVNGRRYLPAASP